MAEDNKRLLILGSKSGGGGGAATWGSITGTLSDQTDLQNALNTKADSSSVPTSTSDLTNDSGFRTVVEINDMTQAELLDFYTNYATLMAQNTYVVDGHEAVATTMQLQPYGTVLILESNVRYKNELAGAPAGTIDAAGTATYIFADGSKQRDNLTFNFPETSGLATVATSGSYNDLSNKPTIPTVDVTAAGNNTFTGNNTFSNDTLIGDLSDIALNLTVDTYGMPQIEGTDSNTYKGFYINTDGIVFNDSNLGDDTGLGITLDSSTGDVSIYAGFGGIELQSSSVTVGGNPVATTDMLATGTNDGTNWTSLTIGSDTYAIPSGGGSQWFGTQAEFDSLSEYDESTDYFISDKIDYNTDIKHKPNLTVYATKTEVNTKNNQQDAKIAGKLSGHFMTQQEFDALGNNVPEGENYFIQGDTVQMVVTFTDQTTATYNVVVD